MRSITRTIPRREGSPIRHRVARTAVGEKPLRGNIQICAAIRTCRGRLRRSMAGDVRLRMLRRMAAARPRITPDITDRILRAIVLRIRDQRVRVMGIRAVVGRATDIRDMRLRDI